MIAPGAAAVRAAPDGWRGTIESGERPAPVERNLPLEEKAAARPSGARRHPLRRPSLIAALVAISAWVSIAAPNGAFAEGSRSLYPSSYNPAGARADMDLDANGGKYLGLITHRTFLYVYAETGEYIVLGSRNRGNGGDIRVYNPQSFGTPGAESIPGSTDFTCSGGSSQPGVHFAGSGRGTITSRSQELGGPNSADDSVKVPNGFKPCAYQAPATGIYGVLFTRASNGGHGPSGEIDPPGLSSDGVSAWDVTVRADATSVTDLNARLFTYAFVGANGGNSRRLYSSLYYVSSDGYRYRQTLRGLDPASFVLFANNAGFLDSGDPLYRDIRGRDQLVSELPDGITSQPPLYPIFFSDITPGGPNEAQYIRVAAALGLGIVPLSPVVGAIVFRGNLAIGVSSSGAGGTFEFTTRNTFTFEIVISRDGTDFSPTNPQNRVLRGVAGTGVHSVIWDGRDNSNAIWPAGADYPFRLTGRNGEIHFPFIDAEGNASGGPTIEKLNGSGGTTVFYDDRGYVTRQGESVGTPNGLLCPSTPPTPPTPDEAVAGIDSNAVDGSGRYYRYWPGHGNTNRDCDDDSAFGDTKGLDLWAFEGTEDLPGTLTIIQPAQFADVGVSVAVPVVVFPAATVFGTLVYRNDGLDPASGVTYGFTLGGATHPASVSFPTLGGGAFTYDAASGVVTFLSLPTTLARGQQVSLPFNYPAPPAGLIPVHATIASPSETPDQTSPNTANGVTIVIISDVVSTVDVPPQAPAGSSVEGTVTFGNSATALAGARNVTYSLTIGNATLRPAAVTFTTLPPGVVASFNPATGTVTFTGMPTVLGRGQTLTIRFTYVAPASGAIPVAANLTTATPESSTANNPSSGSTTFVSIPDLTITKTHGAAFTQGQTGATFTVTVTNLGPGASVGPVTVTDTLPAGLTATALAGPGWTCVLADLTCTRSNPLASGSAYPPITVTVDVAADAPPLMTNVAVVSGGGEANTANDTASDPVTVIQVADLTIAKSHVAPWAQGDVGRPFTIVVSNLGPGPTTGTVTVTDALPAGLSATALAGPGWTCVLGTLTCTRGDVLAAGASYPAIVLTVDVSLTAVGALVNRVTVAGGGELNTANDTALDPVAITSVPDLAIAKAHTGTFARGQTGAVFTITVTNVGAAATAGPVTVSDTPPAGLTPTAIAGPGWACVLATLSCTRSDVLAAGAAYPPITLTVNVSPAAAPALVNTASVALPGEANTDNNTATDPVVVLAVPDLTISKTHGGDFVRGGRGSYTLVVRNVGTASTSGPVPVLDTLPPGLSALEISGAGWVCRTAPLGCIRFDPLAPGASYPPITIAVSVDSTASGTLTNQADVRGVGEVNLANNTATDSVAIGVPPDLTLTKTATQDLVQGPAGGAYEIVVTNTGPVTHTGLVVVYDVLPQGLEPASIAGAGWTCQLAPLGCRRSDSLAAGASFPPITLVVNVPVAPSGVVTNRAVVAGQSETNFRNNAAQAPVTPPAIVPVPTLSEWAFFAMVALMGAIAVRRLWARG